MHEQCMGPPALLGVSLSHCFLAEGQPALADLCKHEKSCVDIRGHYERTINIPNHLNELWRKVLDLRWNTESNEILVNVKAIMGSKQ